MLLFILIYFLLSNIINFFGPLEVSILDLDLLIRFSTFYFSGVLNLYTITRQIGCKQG